MKSDEKTLEKAQVSSSIVSVVKKLKRIKSRVVFLDMREHARVIDKNICDLIKLRRDIERDE